MKIKRDNALYIQSNDIAYVFAMAACEQDEKDVSKTLKELVNIFDDQNFELNSGGYDFFKLTSKDAINRFDKMTGIIDYDDIRGWHPEYVLGFANGLNDKLRTMNKDFDPDDNSPKTIAQRQDLISTMNQYQSFMRFYLFLNDEIEMPLPEGVEMPVHFKKQDPKSKWFKKLHKNIKEN